jgi:exopolysaccharide biosynthesis polyprenyl glycosylphosphotransferase
MQTDSVPVEAASVATEHGIEPRSLPWRIPSEVPRRAGLVAGEAVVAALVAVLIATESEALAGSVVCTILAVRYIERASSGGDPAQPGLRIGRQVAFAAIAAWAAAMTSLAWGTPLTAGEGSLLALLLATGWSVVHLLAHRSAAPQKAILVGGGEITTRVANALHDSTSSMTLLGYVDDVRCDSARMDYLGELDRLDQVIRIHGVDRVLVGFSYTSDRRLAEILRRCDALGVEVDVVPRLFDLVGARSSSHAIGTLPLIHIRGRRRPRFEMFAKRTIDIVGAATVLAITSPMFALAALLVKLHDGGPVLYRQVRVGRERRPFSILKFRTMVVNADELGRERIEALGDVTVDEIVAALKPPCDPRVTPIGGALRRTSLDELPQLINVLRGDMSLVGPRPLRQFEVDALEELDRSRLIDRPGITGLWQISGRSDLPWDERMRLDYAYTRHWSLAHDLEILARTPSAVLRKQGAE